MTRRPPHQHPALRDATIGVALGHLTLAVLIGIGHAGYGGRPTGVMGDAATSPLWLPTHVAVAFAVIAAEHTRTHRLVALSLSFGTLACWSVLMWIWAVHLDPDATWAVSALGLVLAITALTLSGLWADRED